METQATPPTAPKSRGRSAGVYVVLLLAGVLLLLTSFAVWVDRVALNTDVFVDTSSELIEDDAIRQAVAQRAVDELYANVDVEAAIEERLPDDVKSFAGPTAAGFRQVAPEILDRALEQPALHRLWQATLERTHKELVGVLEGGGTTVSTAGGVVTLDLRLIVLEAADRIGIRDQVEKRLDEDAGRIEVLRSDELDIAQDAFQLLKTLAWVLPLLTLAAFGGAVGLALDRRRVVRGIGITILVVGVLGLVAANLTGNYVVGSLVEERDTRPAADNAWDILTDLMRGSFRWMVLVGILFVVASWLAGHGRRAVVARRALAPAMRERVWAYVGLAVVGLTLLLTGPVGDFSGFLGVAVLIALGVVWIELMRAQTLREFPGASGTEIFEDARTRMASWWEARRAATVPPSPGPGPSGDLTSRLLSLADLHARGELTDEEYAAAKSRVLAGG